MFKTMTQSALLLLIPILFGCGNSASPSSNGESIYVTGKDSSSMVISADVDRESLRDQSLVLSCAGCHGVDRRGAKSLIPDFGPYIAPDITRQTLLRASSRRPAYDAVSLRQAITKGKSPSGKSLHYPMPRWNVDGKNLDDLIRYLLVE